MITRFLPLLLLFSIFSLSAQEERPEVGLVLSGGGAKGLAHIGVLKVLEEAGVQVDYIGGTSMGAIIGGLYSAGYSADELDSIFRKTNFNILIQDELPRKAMSFYERKSEEKYAITLPFDGFEISFPSAYSKGQNIYNLMSRLTLHLEDKKDFSNLPIPFFAVATDVETGEAVILDEGYLPQAMAASSAIPSLFSPVKIGQRLYIDGGVANNYPVEELRRRGADFVIGVDVQDSLVGREHLQSAFEILGQISNFRTLRDMESKIDKTDIYINPDISRFNIMSFEKGKEIIKAGELAARKHMEDLEQISHLQEAPQRDSRPVPVIDSLFISDVRIEGHSSYPRAYILGKLKVKYPAKVSYDDLRFGINNLSATDNFNRINYRLDRINKGYVLYLELEENTNKTLLRLGVHYDDLYKTAALINLSRKSFFLANDVASFDAVLGDNFRYNFNYYIDKGFYWSIGIRSRFNAFSKGVRSDIINQKDDLADEDINELQVDYEDLTNQIYVETLLGKAFSLGLGVEHKYLDISSQTLSSDLGRKEGKIIDRGSYYSGFTSLRYDSRDHRYFPSSGFLLEGDMNYYLLSSAARTDFSPFSVVKGKAAYILSPLSKLSARFSAETGFRIGSADNNTFHFFLGGYGNDFINNFIPFYGHDFIGISGDSFIKALVELDYEVIEKSHLSFSANFANVQDSLFTSGKWFSFPEYSGYAIGYGVETFFGPVEVKYSFSPAADQGHWFFSLGFWF